MPNGIVPIPKPVNEPIRPYAPGSPEKVSLKKRIAEMLGEEVEIPLIIGGKEVRTGNLATAVCPHDHHHVLATYHKAGEAEVKLAIEASQVAWREWSEMAWEDRAACMLKAAELLAGPWRDTLNAATMLNQSKNVFQAEIDSACELIDFYRFNPHYMKFIYEQQPESALGHWDFVEYRALEGFVFAVTPFNFTSIAGNLPTAPALMGNVVLWKPASSAVFTAYQLMRLLDAAGLPSGRDQLRPRLGRPGRQPGDGLAAPRGHPLHRLDRRSSRTCGARSAPTSATTAPTRASSARPAARTSSSPTLRPTSKPSPRRWSAARSSTRVRSARPRHGPTSRHRCGRVSGMPCSARSPTSRSGRRPTSGTSSTRSSTRARSATTPATSSTPRRRTSAPILAGGDCDDTVGYFVQPTVVQTTNPRHKLMQEEIFGPVLTLFVYDDAKLDEALELCDSTSPYALTGAIFADDRRAAVRMAARLRHAAGNFYLNDKPTGAVVGQQPFGGCTGLGHQRQGGLLPQPDPLDLTAHDQGELRPAKALRVPVPGRGVTSEAAITPQRGVMAVSTLLSPDSPVEWRTRWR